MFMVHSSSRSSYSEGEEGPGLERRRKRKRAQCISSGLCMACGFAEADSGGICRDVSFHTSLIVKNNAGYQ